MIFYVIVNPASRSGRGRKIWERLAPVFTEKGVPFQVIFSKGAGHVTRIVKKLSERLSAKPADEPLRLILLGGDGTVNEALQGISDFDRIWIGYIPTGSSNDLARDLGLSEKPGQLLASILEGKVKRTLDLGLVTFHHIAKRRAELFEVRTADGFRNESASCQATHNSRGESASCQATDVSPCERRYFAVSSGIGFDAAVCEEALSSRFKKTLNRLGLGRLTYLTVALRQLIAARRVSCELAGDGIQPPVHVEKLLFTAFMLHRFEGGGFMFCPEADACDGLLDLCVTGNIPKPLILLALPTAFFGKHYLFPQIRSYRTAGVRIKTSLPLWVHTDGEVSFQSDDITVSCIPQKLRLLM